MDHLVSALRAAHDLVSDGSLEVCSNAVLFAYDQEITESSARFLARIRVICNSRAAINCLPDELLIEIFRVLSNLGPLSIWLPATHVCQRWRGLALSAPLLWTTIQYGLPEPLLELVLSRTRNIPLSLSCDTDASLFRTTSGPIVRLGDRIRHITISRSNVIILLRVFAPALANLETLRITGSSTRLVVPANSVSLPIDLPKLNLLSASSYPWRLLSPFMQSLRFMILDDIYGLPSISNFLNALKACPTLEVLKIHDSMPATRQGRDGGISDVVALPKLKRLELAAEDTHSEVGFLCSHLSLPADASIRVEIRRSKDSTRVSIPHVFPADQSLWPSLTTAKHLALSTHANRTAVFLSRDIQNRNSHFLAASFWTNNSVPSTALLLPELLYMSAVSFASRNLTTLDIFGVSQQAPVPSNHDPYMMDAFPPRLWPRMFASFPSLKTFKIRCVQDVTPLLDALGAVKDDRTVPCPEMVLLSIRAFLSPTAKDALHRMLLSRHSRGKRLPGLRLVLPRGKEVPELPYDFLDDARKLVRALYLEHGLFGGKTSEREPDEVSIMDSSIAPSARGSTSDEADRAVLAHIPALANP